MDQILATLFSMDGFIALLSLSAMEIVLGIDNIVFIAILVSKLPKAQEVKARKLGIGLALFTRLALLFSISWIMGLTEAFITLFGKGFSGRELILLLGGLFLIAKATFEIHEKLEGPQGMSHSNAKGEKISGKSSKQMTPIIIQIILIDLVFSLDSVITAVGMAQHLSIMILAMIIAVGVMLVSSGAISTFVHKHPTIKILALSFLLLIGVMLTAEGFGTHVGKGYIYFAMAFSLGVELLNMRYRKVHHPVVLRENPPK